MRASESKMVFVRQDAGEQFADPTGQGAARDSLREKSRSYEDASACRKPLNTLSTNDEINWP